MEAAKAAELRARKERRVEEERRTLLKHLELQAGRLKQRTMMKQAAREKQGEPPPSEAEAARTAPSSASREAAPSQYAGPAAGGFTVVVPAGA